ncbi:helix-turn-helix domain-containing protein [Alkaliphilus sp. B6464]|uniref:helix-turn-helix domain-containing protein n=1 Tax=Alkaliphilus sp. B6464 TaxID=2731219 RepID=UPI001BA7B6DA|nr:helix-turn-helix transcriptional regulator [Alkaliphilus sp. B6464]QUH19966.1 helix-turn-helix transcriptional regulator [Alkaliphilus sp. B6464]
MTFGEKLKALRKEHGYSQEEFAQHLDVSRQAVSKWESDRGTPETEKLLRISTIFGVTLDYLLKDEHTEDNQYNGGYYVSREMIDGFLSYKRQGAKRIAVGVGLIVLSNIFGCVPVYRQVALVFYWVTMALGIAVLVWHIFQPKRYQEIGEKTLLFDDTTIKEFRIEHEKNRKRYALLIILGVIILILSPQITLIAENYFDSDVRNGLSWILHTAWAALFILSGLALRAENVIAQNAKYISKKNSKGWFAWVYIALPVTVIAVVIGIVTNAWSPIIPIIALFCILLATVCKLLIEGRNSK